MRVESPRREPANKRAEMLRTNTGCRRASAGDVSARGRGAACARVDPVLEDDSHRVLVQHLVPAHKVLMELYAVLHAPHGRGRSPDSQKAARANRGESF